MRVWRTERRSSSSRKAGPRNSLPLSESTRSRRQPAAFRSRATRRASVLACSAVGLPCLQITSSAQANDDATSIAVKLPDRAVGALEPPDVEAVDADQLAGPVDVDVLLGAGIARRLVGCGVTGDQPQPLGARVQAVA